MTPEVIRQLAKDAINHEINSGLERIKPDTRSLILCVVDSQSETALATLRGFIQALTGLYDLSVSDYTEPSDEKWPYYLKLDLNPKTLCNSPAVSTGQG